MNGNTKNVSNHANELKAFTFDGTNVALNKTVTASVGSNLAYITNGVYTDVNQYASIGDNRQWFKVDLGDMYNISHIQMYRYWADNRVYYDTEVAISLDNEDYINIFEGPDYVETSSGKIFYLEPVNTSSSISKVEIIGSDSRYSIKDEKARLEKIDRYVDGKATAVVNFLNGIQINGGKIYYDSTKDTVYFE
jgi:hypothetical protein